MVVQGIVGCSAFGASKAFADVDSSVWCQQLQLRTPEILAAGDVANAGQDENINVNRLYVCDSRADDGPLLNGRMRWRPGPQGRAMPYAKKTSHLTVIVAQAATLAADDTADAEAALNAATRKRAPAATAVNALTPDPA